MKKFMAIATMAIAASLSGNVLAHGDKPLHGGIVNTASDLSFELVSNDDTTILYVTDHGKPLDTSRAAGKLTILNGGIKTEVPLAPAGENKLAAKGQAKLGKGAKAVASLSFPDKKNINVRFAVK